MSSEKIHMWKCPKCKREFKKVNQSHSCQVYPLEQHFAGKERARELFEYYKAQIEKNIGAVKIESLPCCIHLVGTFSFGACWAMKDKIRIDFRLDHPIEINRGHKMNKISANRYMYYFDLADESEIDAELMNLVTEAYKLNK